MNNYTTSKFEREKNDHYPTVDERAVIAINEAWDIPTPCIDVCNNGTPTPLRPAVNGHFRDMLGATKSVITNPPYKLPDCDQIVSTLIEAVRDNVIQMSAILVRVQWDNAKGRAKYFEYPFAGSIQLQFRPIWFIDDRKTQPIHSYQWLIWDNRHSGEPVLRYHNGAE